MNLTFCYLVGFSVQFALPIRPPHTVPNIWADQPSSKHKHSSWAVDKQTFELAQHGTSLNSEGHSSPLPMVLNAHPVASPRTANIFPLAAWGFPVTLPPALGVPAHARVLLMIPHLTVTAVMDVDITHCFHVPELSSACPCLPQNTLLHDDALV